MFLDMGKRIELPTKKSTKTQIANCAFENDTAEFSEEQDVDDEQESQSEQEFFDEDDRDAELDSDEDEDAETELDSDDEGDSDAEMDPEADSGNDADALAIDGAMGAPLQSPSATGGPIRGRIRLNVRYSRRRNGSAIVPRGRQSLVSIRISKLPATAS